MRLTILKYLQEDPEIRAAIKEIVAGPPLDERIAAAMERLGPGDMTAGGTPKVKAVEKILGEDVSRDDVDRVWNARQER